MILPREHNSFSVTNPKEKEIHKMPEKEFKIMMLKKLSKIQENANKQYLKIRKTIISVRNSIKRYIKGTKHKYQNCRIQ